MEDIRAISYEEVVKTFINKVFPQIRREQEVPNFNIIFSEEAFGFFEQVMKYSWKSNSTINIEQKNIELLKGFSPDVPTIYVKDYTLFFSYLTDIVNGLIKLCEEYYISPIMPHAICSSVIKRIWLRMGITDFNNVELFLGKQVDFIQNREFDNFKTVALLGKFHGLEIWARTLVGEAYDEATRKMEIALIGSEGIHTLPQIYYDIADDNGNKVCYIYAIQNKAGVNRVSKYERLLYKLNANVENPDVHPNQIFALLKFLELLVSRGITEVRVPIRQVFSYRYHELLSAKVKKDLERWTKEFLEYLEASQSSDKKIYLEKYEHDKMVYRDYADKEEKIEKRKTEQLLKIFMRALEHIPNLELINDLDNNDGTLIFKINTPNISRLKA